MRKINFLVGIHLMALIYFIGVLYYLPFPYEKVQARLEKIQIRSWTRNNENYIRYNTTYTYLSGPKQYHFNFVLNCLNQNSSCWEIDLNEVEIWYRKSQPVEYYSKLPQNRKSYYYYILVLIFWVIGLFFLLFRSEV